MRASFVSRWLPAVIAALAAGWAAVSPARGAAPPAPGNEATKASPSASRPSSAVDVLLLVVSEGNGPDRIAFTYDGPVSQAQAKRDLAVLAKELGQPVPRAKITTEAVRKEPNAIRMTSVETSLPGLVDRARGRLRLEPAARAFRRFPHVRVTFFAFGVKAWPAASVPHDGVRWTASGEPPVYTFDLWRAAGAIARTQPKRRPPTGLLGIPILAAIAAGIAAYLAARAWNRRRLPDAKEITGPRRRRRRDYRSDPSPSLTGGSTSKSEIGQ